MAVIQLINLGITQVLVKLLINLQHADTITNEILTQDILSILGQVIPVGSKMDTRIHTVFSFLHVYKYSQIFGSNMISFQVAQRDQKFASKMKLLNSIKMFHALLRQHYNNSKILLPLLLIIKTLAKNRKRETRRYHSSAHILFYISPSLRQLFPYKPW